ncbi:hypothetical protein FIU97_19260 (plasmid) [Roseivivax sp. THAF40]|nr:hypothetical protein FIU97_19260 [Roseivivax sp. THAF40]
MSDLLWLSDAEMARLEPCFPKSYAKPGLMAGVSEWHYLHQLQRLAVARRPKGVWTHKPLYNRWKRWSDKGVFIRIMTGLAAEHGEETTVMIDATHLTSHRTASRLGGKIGGGWTSDWPNKRRHEYKAACHLR